MSNKILDKAGVTELVTDIANKIASKYSNKVHTHTKSEITDFPTSIPFEGGNADYATNADTLDGKHALDFATSVNPAIEGTITLLRSGNATTNSSMFAWENSARIRNQDPNTELNTYTDLLVTPAGVYIDQYQNGNLTKATKRVLDESDYQKLITLDGWFEGDLNDLKKPCTVIAYNCTNSPTGAGFGTVLCYAGGTGSFVQIYVADDGTSSTVYIRHYNGTIWLGWNNINNADTVDGLHAWTHGMLNSAGGFDPSLWFACQHNVFGDDRYGLFSSDGKQIRCHYASEANNANTLGGVTDAYHFGSIAPNGNGYGNEFRFYCQYNIYGDDRFGFRETSGNHGFRVDYATNADTIDGLHASDIIASSKPYVTGTFTLSGNESKIISLGFTPSFVNVRGSETGFHINVEAHIITGGFKAVGVELTINAGVRYIAFK